VFDLLLVLFVARNCKIWDF